MFEDEDEDVADMDDRERDDRGDDGVDAGVINGDEVAFASTFVSIIDVPSLLLLLE